MIQLRDMIVGAALCLAMPAAAEDFSFTGSLPTPDTVQFFDFTVGAASTVTLRTWSYAGGVNAAGQTIDRGGFDPILALFSLPSGVLVDQNDDGGCGLVSADAVSGACWDTYLTLDLDPGVYRVAVMVYPNFALGDLGDGFNGATTFDDVSGVPNNPRTNQWAFDILNVESAVVIPGGVPEPAAWGLMIAGFGAVGLASRRRRSFAQA